MTYRNVIQFDAPKPAISLSPNGARAGRNGHARLVQVHADGCAPHVLTDWRVCSAAAARAWARAEGADFLEV